MIFTLVSLLLVLLALYLLLSYRAWQLKHGLAMLSLAEHLKTKELLLALTRKTEGIAKTGAHYTLFFLAKTWMLASDEVKRWVFKVSPRLKEAFEEKDKLTGLYHGPASFFLANVSAEEGRDKEPLKYKPSAAPLLHSDQ